MRGVVLACVGATMLASPIPAQRPLERVVTLSVDDAPLLEALLILRRQQGAPLAWRGDHLPPRHRVSVNLVDAPLGGVLAGLLSGTLLTARVTSGGTIVLVPGVDRVNQPGSLTLASGIQLLDQLVVIGSAVGASPEREQATAVTVVSDPALRASPHRRFADQIKAFLPGIVLWDRGGVGPPPTLGGVRGVASFTARAPKVYVDGVELASPELFTQLDGRSVSRLEMIHGPQGAALYGPDALNGVLRITTNKGSTTGGASVAPEFALIGGGFDRDADGTSLWREAAVGLEAGRVGSSIAALGSASRLGETDPLSSSWRLQGGGRVTTGRITVEGSARAAERDARLERQSLFGDALSARGLPPLTERGGGIRVLHSGSDRLSQSLVAGIHYISGSREPFRSPILPPRLPGGATNETAERRSVRWAGSADLGQVLVSVGAEASHRSLERTLRANSEFGGISTLYDEALSARGAFLQARVRLGSLVLSGGGRSERISSVGVEAESPWAATAGVSWNTAIGLSTLRLRAAWGRALRPPEPGMAVALAIGSIHQESNPSLRAERQAGVEVGAELHFPSGAWLSATWFDQRADDLVQQVDLRRNDGTTRFYQFQNVGAIDNRGAEFDGGLRFGKFAAAARVHLVDSRIAELSPTYTGEFESGDSPLEVPEVMGSVAVRYETGRSRIEIGANYLGSWVGYDWKLVARAEAGQAPVRDRAREYWLDYDPVVRPFIGVSVPIGSAVSLWGRAETALGGAVSLRDNLSPSLGRSLLFGLEMR